MRSSRLSPALTTTESTHSVQRTDSIDRSIDSAGNADHAMVIVGLGHDDTLKMDYWLIKNSFGAGVLEYPYWPTK